MATKKASTRTSRAQGAQARTAGSGAKKAAQKPTKKDAGTSAGGRGEEEHEQRTGTKKTGTKKTAKKTAKKSGATRTSRTRKTSTSAPAGTGGASTRKTTTTSVTKKTTTTPATRKRAAAEIAPTLVVREDESPWTEAELKQVRSGLEEDVERLRSEIQLAESDLVDLMRDSNDGAGDDQADAGAKTFEREQEITLANNARDMLLQGQHALERLEDGTYGICESCGNAIGKLRLQAAPRATLCVSCKTKEERR